MTMVTTSRLMSANVNDSATPPFSTQNVTDNVCSPQVPTRLDVSSVRIPLLNDIDPVKLSPFISTAYNVPAISSA